jgi:uncharacterized protein YdeI (YjbR/CyaY-like superfamily)
MRDDEEVLAFEDAAQWEAWLAGHHDRVDGVWLKIAKKGSGRTSLTIRDALDGALCYGWIDSQRRSYDESYYLQRYSRRRSTSSWSKVNVDRVEELTAAGRMRPPGLAEVAAAKADGRWDAAYESQRTATVPPDLAAALAQDARAQAAFEALGKTERYAMILQLLKARTPELRAARLQKIIATLRAAAEA